MKEVYKIIEEGLSESERKWHWWRTNYFILLICAVIIIGNLLAVKQINRYIEFLCLEPGKTITIDCETDTIVVARYKSGGLTVRVNEVEVAR